jgi:hypothetical protein
MYEPFGRGFYEWWAGLPPVFRYGVGAALLVVSSILWLFDTADYGFWVALAMVGIVLLLAAGGRHD